MDNNNEKIDDSIKFIKKIYDNLSYYDLYGNSIFIFIFVTIFLFLSVSFFKILKNKEEIADDWPNQRCKPQNMVFAGYISKPDDKTAFQYTTENFQYCVQGILINITGFAIQPINYLTSALTTLFNVIAEAIQKIREMIYYLRSQLTVITEEVLNKILASMIPIQKLLISVSDTFNKTLGVMTASLYTVLASYYLLQTLMGAVLELIIKILVILVIIIVGLWILPFTWPVAATMSLVFLGIAIPLAIIVYFMVEVLHVEMTGIPKLRCFDENTKFITQNNCIKSIKDLNVGEILYDGSIITSKIKVTSEGLEMYNLNGTIVSESHIVNYNDKWIPVREHPKAVLINNYNKPFLYCLNTSNKIITLNNIIYTDWDEIYNDKLDRVSRFASKNSTYNLLNIHKYLDNGFLEHDIVLLDNGFKEIRNIEIGDKLLNGGVVYGIVEIDTQYLNWDLGKTKPSKLYSLLTTNKQFIVNLQIVQDYNSCVDKIFI